MKLYLETTVFNYYFDRDREGHEDVVTLLEAVGSGKYEGYTSEYVVQELEKAPEPKRSRMIALIDRHGITILPIVLEVTRLAKLYIEEKVIPAAYRFDSAHVATASVYELDCIVSYNFQHINRDRTRRRTAEIKQREGYQEIAICTAGEVLQ